MTLFAELVELLEAIEQGKELPVMGPAHQGMVNKKAPADAGASVHSVGRSADS